MDKKLEELTVVELKAMLFDIDQQIKQLQNNFQIVGKQLEAKVKEEQEEPKTEE